MANAPESAQRLVFLDVGGVFTVRADTRSNIAATPAGAAVWADLAAYGQIRSKYALLMSFNLKSVVKKRICDATGFVGNPALQRHGVLWSR
jgi:hypothetical protein